MNQICQINLVIAAGLRDGLRTILTLRPLHPAAIALKLHFLSFLPSQVDVELGDPRLIDKYGASEMLHEFTRGEALLSFFGEVAIWCNVDVVADPEELLLPV